MDKKKTFRVPNWENLELNSTYSELYQQYVRERVNRNIISATQTVVAYTHAATTVSAGSYQGAIISPDGRVYFIPSAQAAATIWHYMETDGSIVAYTHGASCVSGAYCGGVLAPNGRIYLVPRTQATATLWHYIDTTKKPGTTGHVVSYSRWTGSVANANLGGVLGLNGNIYFVPIAQSTATQWCYVSPGGLPLGYSHGVTAVVNGYVGGVLAPDGKIYLMPYGQCTATVWHYIDTTKNPGDAGHVVAYTHGATVVAIGYTGGSLAPDGKIYLGPQVQSTAAVWHYIDTTVTPGTTGHVVAYTHGATVLANGYQGCSQVTPNGRIYLIPRAQSTAAVWHYIDTTVTPGTTGHVVAYNTNSFGFTTTQVQYIGSAMLTNGRLYLSPNSHSTATVWHYIDTGCDDVFSNNFCTSPYVNKTY